MSNLCSKSGWNLEAGAEVQNTNTTTLLLVSFLPCCPALAEGSCRTSPVAAGWQTAWQLFKEMDGKDKQSKKPSSEGTSILQLSATRRRLPDSKTAWRSLSVPPGWNRGTVLQAALLASVAPALPWSCQCGDSLTVIASCNAEKAASLAVKLRAAEAGSIRRLSAYRVNRSLTQTQQVSLSVHVYTTQTAQWCSIGHVLALCLEKPSPGISLWHCHTGNHLGLRCFTEWQPEKFFCSLCEMNMPQHLGCK